MGYLPKHIKVQRQQRILRVIATAHLAGAVIRTDHDPIIPSRYDLRAHHRFFNVVWPDGTLSWRHRTHTGAARAFLKWKHGPDSLSELDEVIWTALRGKVAP